METWFLVSVEIKALGGVVWKRGSFYPRRECVRWSDVKTCFLVCAEGNAFGGVAWKRVYLYPQKAMRSVKWLVNVVPFIRGGQCARLSGV